MSIKQRLQQVVQYLSEAVARIFSPRDDDYPETGVQPFKGEVDKRKTKARNQDW